MNPDPRPDPLLALRRLPDPLLDVRPLAAILRRIEGVRDEAEKAARS